MKTRAYQVRLPVAMADAFDEEVRGMGAQAAVSGAKVSAAGVLSMLVQRWLDERRGGQR